MSGPWRINTQVPVVLYCTCPVISPQVRTTNRYLNCTKKIVSNIRIYSVLSGSNQKKTELSSNSSVPQHPTGEYNFVLSKTSSV
jgi:hypothetical protein